MVAPETARPRADERKLVSVLFADLVGSTSLGEQLDPERLQVLLATYFGAMARVIEGWGGTVEKYIGDAIMAVFGVPSVHEDDAQRAINAALDMLSTLETLNRDFSARHGVEIQIRIGICTGDVVAPIGGPPGQMIVTGDAVNTAARLEAAAGPRDILVGERTHEAARNQFRFDEPLGLELKGKTGQIQAWAVTGRVTTPGEIQARLQAPMVGRDRELRTLTDALDEAVESGEPRLVLVFGPAGIGKSRLAREFIEAARVAHKGLTVLRGRCLSAGDGITFWALGEIVRGAFGFSLDDAADVAQLRLADGVRLLLARVGTQEADVEQTYFSLATSAGLHVPNNPVEAMRPDKVAMELARAWPRFATAQAEDAPLIVFVEDLHWADGQLLDILDALRARSRGPILLLATARPEFAEDHADFSMAREGSSSITLRPLPEREASRMVEGLLGWDTVPEAIQARIVDQAEGNPFFLEQLIGGLAETGALVRTGEGWELQDLATTPRLPDTIQAVLSARIDRLDADEKRVLQEAAVVGRTFWPAAVEALTNGESVPDLLASLEGKGLIVARPVSSFGGELEYAFKHALIHDVAYGAVSLARRARSHATVGEWLETIAGEADEGLLELVAHHYRAALLADGADLAWIDDPDRRSLIRDRAVPVLIAAGAVARRRNAIERSIELHHAALALADTDDERKRIYEELGDDHDGAYHGEASVEAWDQALALHRSGDDDEAIARICVKAARACVVYWGGFAKRTPGATVDAYIDEGLARTHDTSTRGWLLGLRGRAGEAWSSEGLPDPVAPEDRVRASEEAAEIARSLEDGDLGVLALRSLGGSALLAGDTRRALELANQELEVVDDVAAPRTRVMTLNQAEGRVMDIGGEFERAVAIARKTMEIARELAAHDRMHACYFLMAPLYRLGRHEEMEPVAMEHLRAYDEETVDMDCPYTRSGPVVAALVLELLGKTDAAVEAVKRITPNPERPGLVEAWEAERALRTGDTASARKMAGDLVATGRIPSIEEPPYEFAVLIRALAALGDWDALDEAIERARPQALRVVWLPPTIEHAKAMRLAARGDATAARAGFERALAEYERLAMPVEAAEVREQLPRLA
ncbi:MAG: AAA family ATPase [Chloroflexota bacterium]|nr:AAA family ATPase [Chloroflexota bacterium]